jgi:hypothetical protein
MLVSVMALYNSAGLPQDPLLRVWGWCFMRRILLVVTAAMVVALMMVAMALPVFAGGGDDDEDENESASGAPTRNGQIVFRRYFNAEQTKGALFVMNPDGSHVRQITHPPQGLEGQRSGVVS